MTHRAPRDEAKNTQPKRVLVTGARGFVGQSVVPALERAGHVAVRAGRAGCTVRLDLDDDSTLAPALRGADAALYLVHGLDRGEGYTAWEVDAAERFGRACADAGVSRIVYLGGVMPVSGAVSAHLQARKQTGEALRRAAGAGVDVVELRAAMIVGAGSASFQLARDLVTRVPWLLAPPWMAARQEPVAISDVAAALVRALDDDVAAGVYGCPGPEALSGQQVLERVARVARVATSVVPVPLFPHAWAARALAQVARTDERVVKELVQGMRGDLLAQGPSIFDLMPDHERRSFDDAARQALWAIDDDTVAPVRLAERVLRRALRRARRDRS